LPNNRLDYKKAGKERAMNDQHAALLSKSNSDSNIVEPRASHMIEALRDIGYSLESAVADVIDNSISAGAKHIELRFGWDDHSAPWMAIIDDGKGMSDSELVEAMRLGSRDPRSARLPQDLGRFGLGLKTASFSQCRVLTVISRRSGQECSRQWDLDLVRKTDKWLLRQLPPSEVAEVPCLSLLGDRGTLVLWQQMDRLDLGRDPTRVRHVMNERVTTICEHMSLVFHRFMATERGHPKTLFSINGTPLVPFDPFHSKHPATTHVGEEFLDIEGYTVELRPYILPHHTKVSAADYEYFGGSDGYLRGQGFYIYRNRRLIIHSTWFRMARQDEASKLARVQVDIPPSLDHLWTIDVRKSRAQPPEAVKRRLRGIVERVKEAAKRPYTHRGASVLQQAGEPVWKRLHHNDRISYNPNPAHCVLADFRSDLPEPMRRRFDSLLVVIGASLPYPAMFSDMASTPKHLDRGPEQHQLLTQLANALFGDSTDLTVIKQVMQSTEPFVSNPGFVSDYIRSFAGEK
jgi:hypothetical protein